MTIIGIDPGLDGGLAILTDAGLQLRVMPTVEDAKRRHLDLRTLRDILITAQLESQMQTPHAFLEHVGPMPGQGVTSMFRFGEGFGMLQGILAALEFPCTLVRPQAWQKLILAGQPKGSEYQVAARMWPQAEWRESERCRVPHSGLVDAALIALYGAKVWKAALP